MSPIYWSRDLRSFTNIDGLIFHPFLCKTMLLCDGRREMKVNYKTITKQHCFLWGRGMEMIVFHWNMKRFIKIGQKPVETSFNKFNEGLQTGTPAAASTPGKWGGGLDDEGVLATTVRIWETPLVKQCHWFRKVKKGLFFFAITLEDILWLKNEAY